MSLRKLIREHMSTTRSRRRAKAAAVGAGLALTATAALGAIVGVLPSVRHIYPPPSVVLSHLQHDTRIYAFDERQCVELQVPLQTDQGHITAGTDVSCHFLHMDPVTPPQTLTGTALFNAPILGVISSTGLLDASDGPCGLQPLVEYPTGTEQKRGLETQQIDQYQVIAGGSGINVQMYVSEASDQLRVITGCAGGGGGGGAGD